MFIGHYGVSLAAKQRAPGVSLGWLFLAVQGLDVLFGLFVLTGAEHFRVVPGYTAYNPYDLYDMWLSHSLLGALLWTGLTVGLALALTRRWGPALVLGGAVLSHFVLDLPMHTPDLPLAGAGSLRLGLGLWNHRWLSLALELTVLCAGLLAYARARRPAGLRFALFAAALILFSVATPFLPPPASPQAFVFQALAAYGGLAAWATWVDRSTPRRLGAG